MALGQYIAGMGFSNVGLGIVHSMAHGLSALYDTPHGVACAILLPVGLEYNKTVAGERYRAVGKDIQFLAESAYADACRPGNPRDTSVEEIMELYKSQL